jgi:hypothetical protein
MQATRRASPSSPPTRRMLYSNGSGIRVHVQSDIGWPEVGGTTAEQPIWDPALALLEKTPHP